MLKKLLSLVLAATMLSTAFSVAAMASDEPVAITVEPETLKFVTTAAGETNGAAENNTFSGGAWVNKESATKFSYEGEIYAPKTANYTLETFGYHQKDGAGYLSQFSITVNGTEYNKATLGAVTDLGSPYPANGLWSSYKTTVTLKAGKNTISMGPTTTRTVAAGATPTYLFAMDCVKFTEVASTTYRTEWESLPNMNLGLGSNVSCSGTGNNHSILILATTTTADYSLPVNVPVAGRYKFVISANGPDTTSGNESKYSISHNGEALNLEVQPKTNYYNSYAAEIELQAGNNTLVMTGQKRTASDHVCVYGDFYEVTYLGASAPVTGTMVMEGETPVSTANETHNVIDHSAETSEDASAGTYANPSLASGTGYIRSAVADPVNAPGTLTYKTTAPAAGSYGLTLDMGAHVVGENYLSPVKLTIKQGENVIMNEQYVAVQGSNLLICKLDDETSTVVESDYVVTEDNATVKNDGVVYYSNGAIPVRRYTLLDKLNLQAGDVEFILTVDSGRKNIAGGYLIVDALTLQKDINYAAPSITGLEKIMTVGDTANLAVVDDYNTPFNKDECTISWASSNESVLTVSDAGVITTKNPGKATITLTIAYNGQTETKANEVFVCDSTHQLLIDEAKIEGNNIVIKYLSLKDLTSTPVTFIAGRFNGKTLDETQPAVVNNNNPYVYMTKTIPLDGTSGDIRVFAWESIESLEPVYSVTEVK